MVTAAAAADHWRAVPAGGSWAASSAACGHQAMAPGRTSGAASFDWDGRRRRRRRQAAAAGAGGVRMMSLRVHPG